MKMKNMCETKNGLTYIGQTKRIDFLVMDDEVKITALTKDVLLGFIIDPADLRKFLDDNFPEKEE